MMRIAHIPWARANSIYSRVIRAKRQLILIKTGQRVWARTLITDTGELRLCITFWPFVWDSNGCALWKCIWEIVFPLLY